MFKSKDFLITYLIKAFEYTIESSKLRLMHSLFEFSVLIR